MSLIKKIKIKKIRRSNRVHHKIRLQGKTRITVFRTARYIYGQIIDDAAGRTLVSCSSLEMKDLSGDKKTIARAVGLELSKRAQEKSITDNLAFDRGKFLYHGRIKAFADGLREGGLNF
jgi:large subunit ribosomal protein L18